MIDLRAHVEGHSREEIVDAVYYAIRYVKQRATAHRSGKDIFQDASRSEPTARAQKLTMSLVRELERQNANLHEAMSALSALTRDRDHAMTDEERADAEALAAELSIDPLAAKS